MCDEAGYAADPADRPRTGSLVPEVHNPPFPSQRGFGLAALVALSAVTCFAGLRSGPSLGDHESINALAARYSMESGAWLIPTVGDMPRVRKTPLGIWLIGAASVLTGHPEGALPVTDLSARLPSAVAGLANVVVVFWLGSMLYGYRGGLVAGFICAGCAATVFYSHNAQVDMVLTLFTTLTFACFWRGAMHPQPSRWFMAGFYVAFALAMLAKAPLPLAIVGLSLAVYWFITVPALTVSQHGERDDGALTRRWVGAWKRQVSRLRTLWLVPGILLFTILVGAWPVYVYVHVDNALALWRIEYVARFTGELSTQARPMWYYIPIVFALTVPFMASIPEAVASPFAARYRAQRQGLSFVFTWALVGTCFLSTAAFKRPHYLLSVFPAYCLLLAPVIDRFFFGTITAMTRLGRATCYGVPVLIGVLGIAGGVLLQRQYPGLLRPYVFAYSGAFLVWTAACWAYARNRRLASFVLVNLGVPILLLVMWPAAADIGVNAEADALIAALREHGISKDDELIWADKRPNASVEFYSGLKTRRLIDVNEMAGLRSGRRSVSGEVFEEIAQRVGERLSEDQPVYVILRAKYYRLLSRRQDLSTRVLFQLEGINQDADDDLVVFTQGGP
ncbi:MAG: glycosyltransferase family 39 protein [Planctomycetota bacterium]